MSKFFCKILLAGSAVVVSIHANAADYTTTQVVNESKDFNGDTFTITEQGKDGLVLNNIGTIVNAQDVSVLSTLSGVHLYTGSQLNLRGNNAIGVSSGGAASGAGIAAEAGGSLTIFDGKTTISGFRNGVSLSSASMTMKSGTTLEITTSNSSSSGLSVYGSNGIFNQETASTLIIKSNSGGQASNGAQLLLTNVNLESQTSGFNSWSNGSLVSIKGDAAKGFDGFHITTGLSTITQSANGVSASKGGKVIIENGTIENNAPDWNGSGYRYLQAAVYADGIGSNGVHSLVEMNNVKIITQSKGTVGVWANQELAPDPTTTGRILGNNIVVETHGDGAEGVVASWNGSSVILKGNQTSITTLGRNSRALRAVGVGNISMDGGTVTTKGANAIGLSAENLATITFNNASATTEGATAPGAFVTQASMISLNNATILTKGMDSTGIYLTLSEGKNGTTSIQSSASLENSSVKSEQGLAIYSNGGVAKINLVQSQLSGKDGLYNVANSTTSNSYQSGIELVGDQQSQLMGRGILGVAGGPFTSDPTANITLKNQSSWTIDGNSDVTNLINDSSTLSLISNSFGGNNGTNDNGFVTLNVRGNYTSNNGSLRMNTQLDDTGSSTDFLHVEGDATGQTKVYITNRGGNGVETTSGDGIHIIQVDGASEKNNFALVGDFVDDKGRQAVAGGIYAYYMHAGGVSGTFNGDWYLSTDATKAPVPPVVPPVPPITPPVIPPVTPPVGPVTPTLPVVSEKTYSPQIPLYEAYPQILQQLNKLGTLQQRVGNRIWIGTVADAQTPVMNDVDGRGFWMKVEGSTGKFASRTSRTNVDDEIDMIKTQFGMDFVAKENEHGKLVGGIYFQYGHAKADLKSSSGNGDIKTDGYGLGGTLTWYGANDVYVDGVAQVMWYDSDIHSDWLNQGRGDDVVDGNDGMGYALSVEMGRKIALNNILTFTPQAQLSYSSVDFDDFKDQYSVRSELDDGDSLVGRLGVALNREMIWKSEQGDTRRLKTYGIANLYYEFLNGTNVKMNGVGFQNEMDDLWGGLGTGISYNFKDDAYSIYGEIDGRTSFSNFGDSYTLNGTIGLRAKF